MAHSLPSSVPVLAWGAFVALGALACAHPARAATLGKCTEAIQVEGDNLGANLKQNSTELKNVVISGCDTRIEARLARVSRLDFEDSSWTFEGNVHIHMEAQNGSLSSDQAVVTFRDNQIERVTITGSPAEFEQKRTDSDALARGHAGQIVYELGAGTVSLSNDAWLTDGSTEIKGSLLVYDIGRQQVQATSKPGAKDRVRLTITPKPSSKDEKKPGPVTPAP